MLTLAKPAVMRFLVAWIVVVAVLVQQAPAAPEPKAPEPPKEPPKPPETEPDDEGEPPEATPGEPVVPRRALEDERHKRQNYVAQAAKFEAERDMLAKQLL